MCTQTGCGYFAILVLFPETQQLSLNISIALVLNPRVFHLKLALWRCLSVGPPFPTVQWVSRAANHFVQRRVYSVHYATALCHYLCEWAVYKHSNPWAGTLYFRSIAVSRNLGEASSGPDAEGQETSVEFRDVAGTEGPLIFWSNDTRHRRSSKELEGRGLTWVWAKAFPRNTWCVKKICLNALRWIKAGPRSILWK